MTKGIDLSDLILILLFFDIKTLINGSLDAKAVSLINAKKIKKPIKQDLNKILSNLIITLFEKQILNLPKFD